MGGDSNVQMEGSLRRGAVFTGDMLERYDALGTWRAWRHTQLIDWVKWFFFLRWGSFRILSGLLGGLLLLSVLPILSFLRVLVERFTSDYL